MLFSAASLGGDHSVGRSIRNSISARPRDLRPCVRGDGRKVADSCGEVQSLRQSGHDHRLDLGPLLEDLLIADPNDVVSVQLQKCIVADIACALGTDVVAAVDLHHEPLADEAVNPVAEYPPTHDRPRAATRVRAPGAAHTLRHRRGAEYPGVPPRHAAPAVRWDPSNDHRAAGLPQKSRIAHSVDRCSSR